MPVQHLPHPKLVLVILLWWQTDAGATRAKFKYCPSKGPFLVSIETLTPCYLWSNILMAACHHPDLGMSSVCHFYAVALSSMWHACVTGVASKRLIIAANLPKSWQLEKHNQGEAEGRGMANAGLGETPPCQPLRTATQTLLPQLWASVLRTPHTRTWQNTRI